MPTHDMWYSKFSKQTKSEGAITNELTLFDEGDELRVTITQREYSVDGSALPMPSDRLVHKLDYDTAHALASWLAELVG